MSNFNLVICMPMYWDSILGYNLTSLKNQRITFHEKIKEYINLRYPTIKILEIRDSTQPNIYEGQTLYWLWEKSKQINCNLLYLHSKGISNYSPTGTTDNWRQILDYFLIENWHKNLSHLDNNDVMGLRDAISNDFVMSGNCWWSNSSYIQKLPNPLETNSYYPQPENLQRYCYERWVTTNNPKIHYMVDTKTNHYNDYCFLENLI